jgi:hypothetical protein
MQRLDVKLTVTVLIFGVVMILAVAIARHYLGDSEPGDCVGPNVACES